jgi:hypothetical protein
MFFMRARSDGNHAADKDDVPSLSITSGHTELACGIAVSPIFVSVTETENVSRAALKLYLAQPAAEIASL